MKKGKAQSILSAIILIFSMIFSVYPALNKYQDDAIFYGTSIPSQHAAAAAAFIFSKCPNMSKTELHSRVKNTAVRLGNLFYYGAGLISEQGAAIQIEK
ncbi:S8 family serine peptidase [Metabacillus idriensis]|uniref:S8 family serine peptidase n=1 Tax=Metabacillus idriensis TaxID=324768 RepID=UPI003D27A66E